MMLCAVIGACLWTVTVARGDSVVKELDDSFVENSQQGQWLVEFYAPWCGHCKKLEPIYEDVAKRLQSSAITVGRIDCTRYSYAAHHFHVRGFPTIQFFYANQSFSHVGERTLEGIIEFVNRAQGPAVKRLSSIGRFNEAKSQRGDDVFFIFIGQDDPRDDLHKKYVTIANDFLLQSYFYEGPSTILPQELEVTIEPTILVFKDQLVHKFERSESATNDELRSWINMERFPAFPKATGSLVNEMAHTNKLLVMIIIDVGVDDLKLANLRVKEIAKSVCSQHRQKYHKKLQFLWFDDPEIANNIAMETLELPRIVILDPVTRFYYVASPDEMAVLTEETLITYLDDVIDGKIEASGGTGLKERMKRLLYEIYSFIIGVWSASKILFVIVAGIPTLIISILVYALCFMDGSDENLDNENDDESDEILDESRRSVTPSIDSSEHTKSE